MQISKVLHSFSAHVHLALCFTDVPQLMCLNVHYAPVHARLEICACVHVMPAGGEHVAAQFTLSHKGRLSKSFRWA